MLTYAQVTARQVAFGGIIEFVNINNVVFRIWQAGPARVQIQNQNTKQTLQYGSVKQAVMYANVCK